MDDHEPAGQTRGGAVEVREDQAAGRFEILVGGEIAGFAAYRRSGEVLDFVHTEIVAAFQHRGLATELVRESLDSARDRGLGVLPHCSFVRAFVQDHPAYLTLVPPGRRRGFGLTGGGDGVLG